MGFHFVLIHGSMHGAWCWYRIAHLLQQDGHQVTALDLLSGGTSTVAADSIASVDEYHQPLFDFLSNLPPTEKVVIVGHSFGGVSVTLAMEAFPEKIAVAVYCSAIMCHDSEGYYTANKSIQSADEMKVPFQYHFGDGPEKPPTSGSIPKEFQKDYFFGTSPASDVALGSFLIRPIPMKILGTVEIKTTKERYGSIPRIYIRTEKDKALPTRVQNEMIASCPPKEVHSIESDHSPYFSAPEQLHRLLLEIAAKYQ